ncbi:MAG: ABC transporter permease, partial [Hydrogenoanaerobacterium sp.]
MKSKSPSVPYLLWMAIFTVVPLGLVAYFALTTPEGKFTIENISRVGEYSGVLLHSVWLAAVATVICLLIA